MVRVNRPRMVSDLRLAIFLIRTVAARLHLPGKDRFDLMKIAALLEALVERTRQN